jgi:glycerol-3-phosphate dehydrogenase
MAAAALSSLERERVLDRLEREAFDLVVIGGGISGAGIAREATLRGLSVALLEADDYAAGTSSRSSKLIHGGLRYLAHGDVALVRKTALERKRIHALAPHLAEPRWMLVPTRSRAGLLKFRAGIGTYEKLGAVADADRHRSFDAQELAREEPLLDREQFPFACAYREYATDDAHLVLANLRAAAALGAAVLNRVPVESIERPGGGRAEAVGIHCLETGRRTRVRARCIINAAGPWVENVQCLERPDAPPLLHLSKGVHVVIPAERLPVHHMLVLSTSDRRSIFAIRRGESVYVGTTDTSYAGEQRIWPEILREDVEYLLAPLARYLRGPAPTPDDVVGAWAGLRPLVAQPGKPPSEISRRDEIRVGPGGVVTLAGGKLTGYRPMARETLERAAAESDLRLAPAPVDEPPLPGGDFSGSLESLAAELGTQTGLPEATNARLVRLYGRESFELAALGHEALIADAPILAGEVDWSVTHEGAMTLIDVLYRRMRVPLYVPSAREAVLEPLAAKLASLLDWSAERRQAELDAARTRLAEDLAFRSEGVAPADPRLGSVSSRRSTR